MPLPEARLKALETQAAVLVALCRGGKRPGNYRRNPVGYCVDILEKRPTEDQKAIVRALMTPPYKVLVKSGHSIGKTWLAAWLVSWFFDNFRPGICYSTAPKFEHVKDVLWKEIRRLRRAAGLPDHFIGPSAPEMRTSAEHFAKGVTASKGGAFQGQHDAWMFFVFDEYMDVDPIYWEATKTMHKGDGKQFWLAIGNPTTTTTAAYAEDSLAAPDGTPAWHRFGLSSLDHPNLKAERDGDVVPVPNAVSISQVNQWVAEWCEPVAAGDRLATDVEWPPESGEWHRPSPLFQSRVLGRWPDSGSGVWSDSLWAACVGREAPPFSLATLPQIGCDTATGKGEDFHALHARWGAVSLFHETANTMDAAKIVGRLKLAARAAADFTNARLPHGTAPIDQRFVPIKVDDDGTGNAVCAFLNESGYNCVPVGAGTTANRSDLYPNRRSELWFACAELARAGGVYFGGLDAATLRRLKQQLMAPAWDLDSSGKRKVEKKDDTKEKIGRSPDDADAINLAFYEPPEVEYTAHAAAGRDNEGRIERPESRRGGHPRRR